MPSTTLPTPSEDDIDDLLYFARTASLSDLQSTLSTLSKTLASNPHDILLTAIDPYNGNGVLHMASANGHTEIISFILSILPSSPTQTPQTNTTASPLLNAQNSSGNTPLHWASLNGHLEAVKLLIGAGADPAIVNTAGHDAVYEAEVSGKDEVVGWLLREGMGLEKAVGKTGGHVEGEDGEEGDMEVENGEGADEVGEGVEAMGIREEP